ncbi:MAG: hypothetical protein DRP65_04755 [Planctomycetota bacterium]|nr:MAG: hypothetical protein DRP65_04755 [Planctomycetota bacterium]
MKIVDLPTIAIIGPGKVGTSIGILASRAGYQIAAIGGRNKERTIAAAKRIGNGVRACSISEAAKKAPIVLLSVTDDAIEDICIRLAEQKKLKQKAVVVHCSGALSSNVLTSAHDYCKCSIASMHPLQTFPTIDETVKRIKGAYCFCEGDENAVSIIEQLAKSIGMKPVKISSKSKTLYHAAAVMACNYLVVLMDSAIRLAENAGIDRKTAWLSFKPLVTATLDNINSMGTADALTGPIARGDIKTVSRHLHELSSVDGVLAAVYRTMGLYAAEMAATKGTITTKKAEKIRTLLKKV